MVASAVSKPDQNFRGIRAFDLMRDLFGVGRLLEEAFRPDRTFPLARTPMLRDLGVLLWTLGYAPGFPERVAGFVWVEDRKIIGNVTLTPDPARLDRHFISNVAVKREFRRQGIARQMMGAAIQDLRERDAHWALLNVRPDNTDAKDLYRQLGFQEVETNSEWMLAAPLSRGDWQAGKGDESGVRQLHFRDHFAVNELLRAATPATIQQFRAPRHQPFVISWDDRFIEIISDLLIGQSTFRYALERDGKLLAVLALQAQRGPFPHRIVAQAHPDARGAVEREILAFALENLARFPARAIRVAASSAQPELIAALEQAGFKFANGLTLMALALRE